MAPLGICSPTWRFSVRLQVVFLHQNNVYIVVFWSWNVDPYRKIRVQRVPKVARALDRVCFVFNGFVLITKYAYHFLGFEIYFCWSWFCCSCVGRWLVLGWSSVGRGLASEIIPQPTLEHQASQATKMRNKTDTRTKTEPSRRPAQEQAKRRQSEDKAKTKRRQAKTQNRTNKISTSYD